MVMGEQVFQSLIHQGKNASGKLGLYYRTGFEVFQSLIHQGKNARKGEVQELDGDNIGSFNPLFIRGKMQGLKAAGYTIDEIFDVSIPYSSGEKCKALSEGKRPETLNYEFQSLIHQGKNARPSPGGQLNSIPSRKRVSIPYSSGEKCKTGNQPYSRHFVDIYSFNPLFIRGKMQAALEQLIKLGAVKEGFNPLFIRGKMQVCGVVQ